MTRRPAVTLIEVLVSLFIMAIGMLALLALFPLGAISMGQALKDDRCASAAAMAEQHAVAANIRHDYQIIGTGTNYYTTSPLGTTLPATYTGPSHPVYVDPYGVLMGLGLLGRYPVPPLPPPPAPPGGPGISRCSVSLNNLFPGLTAVVSSVPPSVPPPHQLVDRWFSFGDDLAFLANGAPEPGAFPIQRGRAYTWAYLLQRTHAWSDQNVQMYVVVYRDRPTDVPNLEQVYQAVGNPAANANAVTLTFGAATPTIRRGSWILDVTPTAQPVEGGGATPVVNAYFYRVVNAVNSSANTFTLEVQPNLRAPMTIAAIMDNVAEVFDKGTSWQP